MSDESQFGSVIRTSSPGWLASLAKAYRAQTSVTLIDDAQIGVNPINDSLAAMGKKANLSRREWMAVMVALGVGGAGGYLLFMAIIDPEPFSKIAFALGSGALLTAGGGFAAIRVLVGHKPPNIKISPRGFEISFA